MDHRLLFAAAAFALIQGCASQPAATARAPETVAIEAAEQAPPPVASAQFGPLPPMDSAAATPPVASAIPAENDEQRRRTGN